MHKERQLSGRGIYGICLLAVLLFCAPLFHFEYATDTYTIFTTGLSLFGDSMFQNGRLVTAFFFYLFDALSVDVMGFYYASFVLAILSCSFALYILQGLLQPHFSQSASLILAGLTLFNPLSVEYFLFIEKGVFCFAICMSVLALRFFVDFLKGKRCRLLFSYFFITLAAFVYQSIPATFAILAVFFVVLYAKSFIAVIRHTLIAVSIYGFGTLLNFLFIKFVGGSTRATGEIRFSNLGKLFLTAGYLPVILGALGGLALLFGVCLLLLRVRRPKIDFRARLSLAAVLFCKSLFLVAAALTVTLFPLLFVQPNEVWLPCRIAYPIGLLIATLPMLLGLSAPSREISATAFHTHVLPRLLWGLLVLNFLFFQTVMVGRLYNNAVDEALCRTIGSEIEAYEQDSGTEIKFISIYYDVDMTAHNPGVLYLGDSNVRAFSKEWSDVVHMNVLLDRDFEKAVGNPDIYTQYFAEKNWDSFDLSQLVFVGDTLHLCVY